MIRYLDEAIRPLVLVSPKRSEYFRIIKDKGDKDKNKNNRLMSFRIGNNKLLEKYKTILTKIEVLKNIELKCLHVFDGTYLKTKMSRFGDKVHTNFYNLNMPQDIS